MEEYRPTKNRRFLKAGVDTGREVQAPVHVIVLASPYSPEDKLQGWVEFLNGIDGLHVHVVRTHAWEADDEARAKHAMELARHVLNITTQ